ncbi:hypothetical protein BJ138DRAFT_1129331 [Hygrophoropsis aurantiaca]|uniref:Uncharacterized protein n=1 Tax=Hygrophoropsis aurantiaca TaxID=72124 RepID=A0ACB8A2N9_9AGAM|nr:hypothetical protein BJ138DRAFT_1129331 [Hygrophoropsis aurantiaca]
MKGFAGTAGVQTHKLTSLLSCSKVSGRLIDASVAATTRQLRTPAPDGSTTLSVESLSLSTALRSDGARWKQYRTHSCFKRLRFVGDSLKDGAIERLLFPVNISNMHWAVFEINSVQTELLYGDSLDWAPPIDDTNTTNRWPQHHNSPELQTASILPHGLQSDSYSCAIAALNTIRHAVFGDQGEFEDVYQGGLKLSIGKFGDIWIRW